MNVPQYLYGTNDDIQRYFALLVQAMQLALSDNGWTIPNLTAAQVALVISSTFLPVMPIGTIWLNKSLAAPNGKLQFITVQAIPAGQPGGPANATIETITSA